jgi:hypothetical protein
VSFLGGLIITIIILTPFILILIFAIKFQKRILIRSWERIVYLFDFYKINLKSAIPEKKSVLPDLTGTLNGKRIRVFCVYVGRGKSRTLVTRVVIDLNETIYPKFNLSRENIFTKIGEKIGMKDIKTGHEEFDKTFRLKSEFENETIKIFTQSLLQLFVDNKKQFYGQIESFGERIEMTLFGTPGIKISLKQFEVMFYLTLCIIDTKNKFILSNYLASKSA